MKTNTHYFTKLIILNLISILFVGCASFSASQKQLDKSSRFAYEQLKKNQLPVGTWETLYNFDTVPEKLNKDVDVWTGLIITDLINPLSGIFNTDTLTSNVMGYVSSMVNPKTGLLKFYKRFDQLPEDADDTGLFWLHANVKDSTLLYSAIDSLVRYKTVNGLYYTWLSKDGISKLRRFDKYPNPVDFLINIHVYLMLKKYAPKMAEELCNSLNNSRIISKSNYWVYNNFCPWLYYIREIDLKKCSCVMQEQPAKDIKPLKSQETYTEMAKLIRDLALKGNSDTKEKAKKILLIVADNDFAFIKGMPFLIFNNDYTSKTPTKFWSYDMAYALWLRLYYEYRNNAGKG